MANTIILKRSATPGKVPTTSQLALGEIAINTYDGLIYIKKNDGTESIAQIGGVTSVNTKTGSVTLSTTDISEGSNQYFTQARARGSVSAGSGISYNSGTGVISTAQTLTTAGTPTFAGLTLTGSATTKSIIPSADNTYSLGSATMAWKDVYVGPGSLYVNGKEVIHDTSGTMNFTTDQDQNMRISTSGSGVLQLGSSSSNTVIQIDNTLQITSGKRITDSAGVAVNFGDAINMNSDKIINLGAPSANSDAATKKYVDDSVSALSTSTISQGNSSIAVVDSGTGQVLVTVDGSTALTVDSTGVTVAGNFTVSGTQTVVNSNTINLADNIITLNSDATGTPTQNAGIEVKRGDSANVQLRWNEGSQTWTFTNDGAVYYPIAVSTTDLAEGTSLYFTTARARNSLSASTATGISYNSSTGVFSVGSIPNSSLSNNSITINGASVALGGTRTLGTDDVSEGSTNLYYSNTRARGAVSAGTGIAYNSSTGVISTSAIPNASLTNSKVTVGSTDISLGGSATTLAGLSSVTSTSFVGALTGNADTATTAGKWTTARTITLGGDLSGSVSIDGSSNVTLNATVTSDAVALGTDTTGNYVASVTSGTGITVSGSGEGAAVTVSLDTATSVDKTTAQTLTNKSLSDNTTYIIDETDGSKKAQFQAGSISTNTTRTFTFPDVNGTLVTTGDTGSVTNAMLVGSIANSKLSNSSVTINGQTISLGGSGTITAQAAAALTIGNGLSGTSYNGSGAVTIAIDTATTVDKNSLQTLTNKSVQDGNFYIIDDSDTTKKLAFSVGGITTGTTRTLTVGDVSGTIVTTGDTGSVTNTMLAGSIANAKLANSSTTIGTTAIALGASATTIAGLTSVTSTSFVGALTGNASTVTNGVYTTDTGTVTNTMLAGSIANAKLANSSTTIGTTAIALGASSTTLAGLTSVTSTSFVGALTGNASTVTNGVYTTDTGTVTNTMLAGSIADSKLSTISTAGKVSNSATTATSANTASAIVARDASGNFTAGAITANLTGAVTGNASTATTLQTARNINGVSFNGSADVTVHTAGTGVSISGTTVSIGQAVGTTDSPTFNNLTLNGNLTVTGTTTSIQSTTLDVTDLNITVAKGAASAAAANGAGLTVAGPATQATLTYTSADDRWNFNKDLNVGRVYGALTGNVTGTVSGNAGTVTNGVYTTDTGTVTNTMLAGSIANAKLTNSAVTVTAGTGLGGGGSVSLGGSVTLTNAGVTSAVAGTYMTVSGATGAVTIGTNATNANTASTIVARDASGNFTAGTITAALTGNASTATTLQTARAINGVSFNGSADVTVHTAGTGIAISGTTVTNSLSTSGGSIGGAIAVTGAITATGEVTAYYSDLKLKTNIVPIADALEKVEAINGVTFDPNETALALGIDDRHQMGVIAQEVEAVAPELVCDSAFKGYKTVRYDKLTALLIEAVKELSAKVKTLEAQLGTTKPTL